MQTHYEVCWLEQMPEGYAQTHTDIYRTEEGARRRRTHLFQNAIDSQIWEITARRIV